MRFQRHARIELHRAVRIRETAPHGDLHDELRLQTRLHVRWKAVEAPVSVLDQLVPTDPRSRVVFQEDVSAIVQDVVDLYAKVVGADADELLLEPLCRPGYRAPYHNGHAARHGALAGQPCQRVSPDHAYGPRVALE